jgi:signal transduction histidine kinase
MSHTLLDLFRRRWIEGLLALMLALGLASNLNVAHGIGKPFGGFFAWRNAGRNVWQLEGSIPTGWPILANGWLRTGDDLVALEGQPYGADAGHLYATAFARGQTTVRLTVNRGGTHLDLPIPLERFSLSQFFDIKLPDLINGMGFWVLAVAIYQARRHDPVNRVFSVGCGLIATALWLSIEGLFSESDVPSGVLRLAWIFSAAFVGPAFIHLIALFPEPLDRRLQRWVPAAYAIGIALAAVYALATGLWWLGWRAAWVVGLNAFGLQSVMLVFAGMVVLVLARLIWLLWAWFIWRRSTSRRQRRQVMFMLVGLVLALPFVALTVGRTAIADAQTYFWNGLDVRYLLLAFPMTHAYVILRYQTFRSAHPLLVAMLILLSSALLASVGAWLVPLVMPQWRGMVGGTLFPTLFIIALGASLFWSTRRAWQGAFNRLFQWEQRSYAVVKDVGHHVVEQIDLRRLPETIAGALVDHLQVECAAVWLWDDSPQAFRLAATAGRWPQPVPPYCSPDPQALSRPVRLGAGDLPATLEPLRAGRAAEVIAPLWVSGELIGLVGLGKRGDEEIFDERDLEIIELIGQQVALFLFTALQVEQLRQVPERLARQVAEAQERERLGIAQELHDTTQQFLGRLPFYLAMSRDAVRAAPAKAENILDRCLTDVETAARTLRQIRNNLAPTRLAQSLEEPLRALVEQTRQSTGLELQLEMGSVVEAGLAGRPEARHALYRVVQQAIDNTVAHAQATQVTIILRVEANRITFSIADNGCGSSEAERRQAAERGSFGLTSMQARITSLGGEFALDSAPGQGTTVHGWLPGGAPPTNGHGALLTTTAG